MIRKYNYSEYFSSIIGYTGRISETEYNDLKDEDDSYTQNDTIGKAGLEQYYESYLRGKNGESKFYIDNVGRITEVISNTDSVAGDDLYLSIDADLQKATYLALQNEIAAYARFYYREMWATLVNEEYVYPDYRLSEREGNLLRDFLDALNQDKKKEMLLKKTMTV